MCKPTAASIGMSAERRPNPPASGGAERKRARGDAGRRLTVGLDAFTHTALAEEAARLDVSIEELARFAVSYYLADLDSGRIAREGPPPLAPGEPHPLGKLLDT
jgi:hypothetical protein